MNGRVLRAPPDLPAFDAAAQIARRAGRSRSSGQRSRRRLATLGDDQIDALLEGGQGVGDGNSAAADGQEGVIVLGVTDADDVVRRQLHLARAPREGPLPC